MYQAQIPYNYNEVTPGRHEREQNCNLFWKNPNYINDINMK